jgi:hypothetical protein
VIRFWHYKHMLQSVGPLIAHASDGDKKRVRCMLDSLEKGTYGLDTPSFIMAAETQRGLPLLMDQDFIHDAKKLRNPILNATRDLFWGQFIATKNHLKLVMTLFPKEEHGLLEEDIDVRDKQNFPAVQRVAFQKVRDCLRKLQDGYTTSDGWYCQEDCRGTVAHLQVIWSFLEVFLGRGTLLETSSARVLCGAHAVPWLCLCEAQGGWPHFAAELVD